MSVLSCNRNGCTNIMCDRYSDKYGYICQECFEELKKLDIKIKKFMESDKNGNEINNWGDKLDEIFPISDSLW